MELSEFVVANFYGFYGSPSLKNLHSQQIAKHYLIINDTTEIDLQYNIPMNRKKMTNYDSQKF